MVFSEQVTLWAIYKESLYKSVIAQDKVENNWSYCDPHYASFYGWMSIQMSLRLQVQCLHPPLWFWYKYGKKTSRPDLRCGGHLPRGTRAVLLELELPSCRILLSQFEMWNFVLNCSYIPANMKEFMSTKKRSLQQTLLSWNNIFSLDWGDPQFWGPHEERAIQACAPFFFASEIKSEKLFVSK